MLRATIFLLVLISSVIVPTADSFATTSVVTVPATVEILQGVNPENPLSCGVIAFAMWENVKGTVSATADYSYDGFPGSETRAEPFDDHTVYVGDNFDVPLLRHWIVIAYSSAAGPGAPASCDGFVDLFTAKIGTSPTIRLQVTTVDPPLDPEACKAAKKKTLKASKKVGEIQADIRAVKESGRTLLPAQRTRLNKKLKEAKDKHQMLKDAQSIACDSGILG